MEVIVLTGIIHFPFYTNNYLALALKLDFVWNIME